MASTRGGAGSDTLGAMVRRALSVLLALTFTLEVPGQARAATQAAAAAAPADVDAKAEALFEAGKYLEAAKVWEDALQGMPESVEVRAQRNVWVIGAINAYKAAFEGEPSRCQVIYAGLKLADRYLADLEAIYGVAARVADDYVGASGRRGALDQVRAERGCAEVPVPTTAPPVVAEPAPEPGPSGPVEGASQPEPRRRSPGLAAGIGVSGALAVAMLVTSGVLYSRLRKDNESGYYYDILTAAQGHPGVATDSSSQLCTAENRMNYADIASACDTWNSQRKAFIATGMLGGVFAASAVVFTALLIHRRRSSSGVTARLREHQVQFGAAPRIEGGAMLTGGLRF